MDAWLDDDPYYYKQLLDVEIPLGRKSHVVVIDL